MKAMNLYRFVAFSIRGNIMQIRTEKSFYVIGISARTSNAKELSGNGVIGTLWHHFFSRSLLARIPSRIDDDIIAVYFDYASDKNGEYSSLIGARVKNLDHVPDEMVGYEVPAQSYALFTSEQGKMPDVEVALWQQIWRQEDAGNLKRAYIADYVVYDKRAHDPANAVVDIYIGLKQ
jgi:predicted transcriptional regulator YdeE